MEQNPYLVEIVKSQNPEWGFYGTVKSFTRAPRRTWNAMLAKIVVEAQCSPEEARDYVDTCSGRHFADQLGNVMRGYGALPLRNTTEGWEAFFADYCTRPEQKLAPMPMAAAMDHMVKVWLPEILESVAVMRDMKSTGEWDAPYCHRCHKWPYEGEQPCQECRDDLARDWHPGG